MLSLPEQSLSWLCSFSFRYKTGKNKWFFQKLRF